jgi:hypothetical protein
MEVKNVNIERMIKAIPNRFHFSLMLIIPIIKNVAPEKKFAYSINSLFPDIRLYPDKAVAMTANTVPSILNLNNWFTPCVLKQYHFYSSEQTRGRFGATPCLARANTGTADCAKMGNCSSIPIQPFILQSA